MALNIKNPIAERLAQELARETGESLTEAVTVALRERLEARRRQQRPAALLQEVAALQTFLREHPDRDARPADAILGYDAFGLPG
jgi:antitoxin VapB